MKDLNEIEIVRLHSEEKWTLRRIAKQFSTDHHTIRRILEKNNVEILAKGKRAPFTEEHRIGIGKGRRGKPAYNRGVKADDALIRKYMAARMRTEIDLSDYESLDKLRLLIGVTSRHFKYLGHTDDVRKAFLDRFYFDDGFNAVYDAWIAHEKDKWRYPSLDHINPKANGGNFEIDNLRFITWFENRAKADMPLADWESFKSRTNTKSDLFIEVILESYRSR